MFEFFISSAAVVRFRTISGRIAIDSYLAVVMSCRNIILSCLCLISLTVALPTQGDVETAPTLRSSSTYASDASQIIALNLLKSNIDIDGNQVHSPLGVTSLLAVLAEAAAGDTYDEFIKVFGYPKERSELRAAFKRILGKYNNKEYSNHPSFQTWLYIYRNNTAREEFKQILRDSYFVEVKDISREEYDWNEPNTSISVDSIDEALESSSTNSKDVVGFETLKRISVNEDDTTSKRDTYGEEVLNKEASKFDRVVDDKQYVEKPVIIEEISKQQQTEKAQQEQQKLKEETVTAATAEKLDKLEATGELGKPENALDSKEKSKREEDANPLENETVLEDEKLYKNAAEQVVPIQEVLKSNEPEKVSIPLQKLENAIDAASKDAGEIMLALESHISTVRRLYGARSLFQKDDIASALSANSITGRDAGSKTKMLLFNGLYYRGYWKNAFLEKSDADEFFFMTPEDAVKMQMMHTRGKFQFADLEHLNAKVICLPYQNEKYSMIIVLPKEIEGLRSVIEKLQVSDFDLAYKKAEEKELHVIMPKFQAEETSRSEAMLKNLGLRKLFSREDADLSLLTEDGDLHVDELVQFVTLRVDEGGSSENGLSATISQGRTNGQSEMEIFEVNRPFLYFVIDCEERFVIASGKIYAPEYKKEEPITIEVELDAV